ncbi:MAG: hypothetical protein DKT66_01985 [Candidatus Melainabacteria bacterium]|nr:MAG: hypothetical protein DKT66_01985 [Candidatus Melainabacteria bacterium]
MALLGNREPTSKDLQLSDGVLRTTGALVSMKVPDGWSASMSTASNPGFPPETLIDLNDSDGLGLSIGLYFSGLIDDEIDGEIRKENLFEREIMMKAGTPEATQLIGGEGALANDTKMLFYILSAGRHAVQSDEKYCRAIKSTDFNGLRSVMYEFENESDSTRTIEYCIDVLGNGRVVYILYYHAPIETFMQNMDTAVSAFQSSVWRKDFDPMIPLDVVE